MHIYPERIRHIYTRVLRVLSILSNKGWQLRLCELSDRCYSQPDFRDVAPSLNFASNHVRSALWFGIAARPAVHLVSSMSGVTTDLSGKQISPKCYHHTLTYILVTIDLNPTTVEFGRAISTELIGTDYRSEPHSNGTPVSP
jgi:hypothetical protein